jgi:hypothetical protein
MYTFVLSSGGEESARAARYADLHRLLTTTQGQSVAMSGKLPGTLKGQAHQTGLNRGSGQFLNFSCFYNAKSVFLAVNVSLPLLHNGVYLVQDSLLLIGL